MTKDVVKATPMWDDEALAEISSFDDAIRALQDAGVALVDSQDFGTGFKVTEKATLVGVPFIIMDMRTHDGTFGTFAILHLVTEDGRKCIINDGSTGIKDQVLGYLRQGVSKGVRVESGLTRSDYVYKDDKGTEIPATTYYLS